MSWMLLWKGKGTNPSLSPDGSFIGYERAGGVVLENAVRRVEIYRNPKGMNPQWWSEDEFAFRVAGQTYFYTYDLGSERVNRMYPAPGAVFLCNNRHWCSWEKKSGRLWIDGEVVKNGAAMPHYLNDEGDAFLGHPLPEIADRLEEMALALKIDWVKTPSGLLVAALELPEKKLKVFVEEPKS